MKLQLPMSCTLHDPLGAPLKLVQMPRPFWATEHAPAPLKVEHCLLPTKPVEQKLINVVPGFKSEQVACDGAITEQMSEAGSGPFSAEQACRRAGA